MHTLWRIRLFHAGYSYVVLESKRKKNTNHTMLRTEPDQSIQKFEYCTIYGEKIIFIRQSMNQMTTALGRMSSSRSGHGKDNHNLYNWVTSSSQASLPVYA